MLDLLLYRNNILELYIPETKDRMNALGQCDCGGACVESIGRKTSKLSAIEIPKETLGFKSIVLSNNIISIKINNLQFVLFNLYQGTLLILNNRGYRVLQELKQPIKIADFIRGNQSVPRTILQDFIFTLYIHGILIEEGQNSQIPQWAYNSDVLVSWLNLTNQCQLNCNYCYVDRTNEYMDKDTVKQILKSIFEKALSKKYKRIRLKYAGGESTLVPDILISSHLLAKHLAETYKLGLECTVLTNGIDIPEHLIDFSVTHKIKWAISLNNLCDHHASSVLFSFNKLQQCGLSPQVTITLTQENVKEFPKVVKLLLEKKIRFNINFYRQYKKHIGQGSLRPDNLELIRALRQAYRIIENDLPEYSLLSLLLDRVDLQAPHIYPCVAGYHYMAVNQNGGIVPCQMLVSQRQFEQPFYNPTVFEKPGYMGKCPWNYYCAGGCPVDAFHAFGHYDACSPYCQVYRTLAPEVLRLEALRVVKYGQPVEWDESQLNK